VSAYTNNIEFFSSSLTWDEEISLRLPGMEVAGLPKPREACLMKFRRTDFCSLYEYRNSQGAVVGIAVAFTSSLCIYFARVRVRRLQWLRDGG
jgi:hypothetical protein